MNTVPDVQIILGFKEFFKTAPPPDRLRIVENICKENLTAEIAGLNHRLKPRTTNYYDTGFKTQIEELKYFCRSDKLREKYVKVMSSFIRPKQPHPLIFTRQTCLFALEEIVQSSLPVIDGFRFRNAESWDAIFRYLLAVNTAITAIRDEREEEAINFETLNPKMLPLNELGLSSSLLHIPFRGLKLFEFLQTSEETKGH